MGVAGWRSPYPPKYNAFPGHIRSPETHLIFSLVAFSEPPSDSTWLENAEVRFPTHSFPGNSLNFSLVAFSEPPSDSTWLENAPLARQKKPTAPKRDGSS
jgi:hypothetical protein